jgi:hypothetical protein
MSQRGVEIVLGRLATDEALRERFRESPASVLRELIALGLELSPVERAALVALDGSALHRFASALDPRLQKAPLLGQVPSDAAEDRTEEA